MTLVILLLTLLALCVGSGFEPSAPAASSVTDEIAEAQARAIAEKRHTMDGGLASQPLLSRPGVRTGKARPAMTSHAQSLRSPWQGETPSALNLSQQKGLMAIDARIPSGGSIVRASDRAR